MATDVSTASLQDLLLSSSIVEEQGEDDDDAFLEALQTERLKRDLASMVALDPIAARALLPADYSPPSEADAAVIRIQSRWRQRRAQREFTRLLWDKYEADEAARRLREQKLVEDTLQMLDRLALQRKMTAEAYMNKCRKNHQNRVAYSIQCVYRRYSSKKRPSTSMTSSTYLPSVSGGLDDADVVRPGSR
ncbi:Aste57867_3020 [Aphanomyces stellatus]|uniref:Aste57867_3020 protein n=1 Tax=Aphanomyces stellatus TaxID=120398 RepID=A0A485KAI1_9STRA|nr:hypothetical protein As57867_003011 [Aphanomyces stellatus]VFT80200.1 Aste57867_3020 [Aphanomyces stellatus]